MLELLKFGGKVTLLGLGTTFAALAALIAVIEIINKILDSSIWKKDSQEISKAEIVNTSPEEEHNNIEETEDEELIAVITAAIAASLSRSTHDIYVQSVKRVPNHAPAWNLTSRREQIATRL